MGVDVWCGVWGASSDGAESGPTYNELAEQTDHGHRDAAGARPQPAGVPQPRDNPADVVAHVAALTLPHTTRTLHTALSTTITSPFDQWTVKYDLRPLTPDLVQPWAENDIWWHLLRFDNSFKFDFDRL